jgi:hypothetical protein
MPNKKGSPKKSQPPKPPSSWETPRIVSRMPLEAALEDDKLASDLRKLIEEDKKPGKPVDE